MSVDLVKSGGGGIYKLFIRFEARFHAKMLRSL